MKKVLVGLAAAVPLVGGTAACAPAVPEGPAAAVTANPEPYGPLAVSVVGRGCEPDTPVAVKAERLNRAGNVISQNPVVEASTTSDATGAWSSTIRADVAYPGRWTVTPGCGAAPTTFTVATPPDMELTMSPRTARAGETVNLRVQGRGCRGRQVLWALGPVPAVAASDMVETDAAGGWSGSASFAAREILPGQPLALSAICYIDILSNEPAVLYTQSLSLAVEGTAAP